MPPRHSPLARYLLGAYWLLVGYGSLYPFAGMMLRLNVSATSFAGGATLVGIVVSDVAYSLADPRLRRG